MFVKMSKIWMTYTPKNKHIYNESSQESKYYAMKCDNSMYRD